MRCDDVGRQSTFIEDDGRHIFTSFSDDFGKREMYKEFQHYDDINEIIIPLKCDIKGNQCGFVLFFNGNVGKLDR